MKDQENEVFNVQLQSTRPDGYRRGGFSLSRGINRLSGVTRSAVIQFKRDHSLLVLEVEPVGMGELTNGGFGLNENAPGAGAQNAGAQSLDAGGLNLNVDNLNAESVNLNNGGPAPTGEELTLAERLAALISQLTPEQYTQGGVPDAKALAALAGIAVSAADRDAAFALYQQQNAANGGE